MINPRFSVILPCYNITSYLKSCLDSIFINDMRNQELILINDGSTDSFVSFCNAYFSFQIESDYFEKEYGGCNVIIINQTNQGVSCSRNRGIDVASHEYCLFVDPDDRVSENWLSEILAVLSVHDYDMILFGYLERRVDHHGTSFTQTILPLENYEVQTREEAITKLLPRYIGRSVQHIKSWARNDTKAMMPEFHSVWRVVYNREFLRKHHLRFPEQIVLNEDGIFNSNCIAEATQITTIMKPLYQYTIRSSGACNLVAREGARMVDNKLLLLGERVQLLNRLKQEQYNVGVELISGSTILSIFEMLIKAPGQYARIKAEYIMNPIVLEMIHEMPYVHKLTFDGMLFLLKHRLYLLLRMLTSLVRPLQKKLGNR